MKLTLLDTVTGVRKEIQDDCDGYYWSEGNGSCDCNRAMYFGVGPLAGSSRCIGCKRFLIVACDNEQYSLFELNECYQKKLLRKHEIIS